MVTAVEPGFDIIEMGFDEYLRKPPSRGELLDTVDRLIHRGTLDEDFQEYYSLIARRSTLEAEYETDDLESNEEYADLVEQIERYRTAVDDAMGDLSSDSGFIGAVREIMDGLTGDRPQNHDNSEEE